MSHFTKLIPDPWPAERSSLGRTPDLTIASRFCGPSRSGNGGYTCGRVAAYADDPVTVTLHRPPPLATPMAVEQVDDGSLRIRRGHTLIAEGTSSLCLPALEAPGPVSAAEARMASGQARYFQDPLFPDCFVCGMDRQPGDGLRIFPGPVHGGALWAAPWTPDSSVAGADGRVRAEIAWAALDCPSGIAAAEDARLGPDTAIVLGQMTASLTLLPVPGDQCRVVAWPAGRDGRKLTAASALLGPGGEVLAAALTVWITVPRPLPVPATGGTS
jgi:hypothetical protein